MKIAQIAPIIESIPPQKYGGTERVVYSLTEELVRRGHDVTLFASGDSLTTAKLCSVYPRALRVTNIPDLYGDNIWNALHIGLAYQQQNQFDIIHDHTSQNSPSSIALAQLAQKPVVVTLHGPIDEAHKVIFEVFHKPHLVTISQSQAKPAPNLHYAGNVYNGLSMASYPFSAKDDGYLLYVGRISHEKGIHHAIETAQALHLPFIIAAKLDDTDRPYFEKYIKPHLNDQIRWIGEVDETQRNELMSKAKCFLHPVTWPEPFGLTLIESMACGCPVVAFNQGSIPEVIQHGKTGFVTENVEEMINAVQQIGTIDRQYCRTYSLKNFSAKRMADGYEKIYQDMINQQSSIKDKVPQVSPMPGYFQASLLQKNNVQGRITRLPNTDNR